MFGGNAGCGLDHKSWGAQLRRIDSRVAAGDGNRSRVGNCAAPPSVTPLRVPQATLLLPLMIVATITRGAAAAAQ